MTRPSELDAARRRTDNLARLLADERGAEILAELQKLRLETACRGDRPAATRDPDGATDRVIGAWHVVPTPNGPELHGRELDPAEARTWADVEHVPAAGRNARVVLLGESSARGFLLDPVFNPALALQRRFHAVGDGVQVVDLAHTGADIPDLLAVARRLPLVEPDVIVVYAGNNWVRSRHTPAHLDLLASALRADGYPGMRRCYLERIVAPGVRGVLDVLADVARTTNAQVVVVVPEFNLGGWQHDAELELPPLPPAELLAWTGHRERAEAALENGDTAAALTETIAMRALDHGLSPVTGRLRGLAALVAGDTDTAAAALAESRDSVCGLFTTHTPRITTGVRDALIEAAEARGFHRVDLAALLRTDPNSPWPDPAFFLDYCHLSADGIDRLAEVLSERVRDLLPEDTPRRQPSETPVLSIADRAVGDILAAVHNSYYGQPRERVAELVEGAVGAHPAGREFAAAMLRLLASAGPVWSCAATPELLRARHAARYLAPMLSRSAEHLGMWELRAALTAALGIPSGADEPNPARLDLLATAEQGLLDGAFRAVNHLPERAFFQAFGRVSRFGCHLDSGCAATLSMSYRVPASISSTESPATVAIRVNGHLVTRCPATTSWTKTTLAIPDGLLRAGINSLEIGWPTGGADWLARRDQDAAALARGEYPVVLAVQGEVFELLLTPQRDVPLSGNDRER